VFDAPNIRAAMQERMDLMLAAARESQLPGTFESWRAGDLYATRASDPELRFLCSLSVSGSPTIEDLRVAMADPRWEGIAPTIVFDEHPEPPIDDMLRDSGYTEHGWRPMAVRSLDGNDEGSDTPLTGPFQVLPVGDADLEEFVTVLLAGYEATGVGARFIEAGHRSPEIQRFAVWSEGHMIATAGMSLHGEVAALGGASTLSAARGQGAQSLLLRYRLLVARQTGCAWAVATAGYGSQSARNMERAGFAVHNRPTRHIPG
jgi:GNAT superfamily N-acetyltransferase